MGWSSHGGARATYTPAIDRLDRGRHVRPAGRYETLRSQVHGGFIAGASAVRCWRLRDADGETVPQYTCTRRRC